MNVRLEGIEYTDNESEDQLKVKIENSLKDVGVDITNDMFVRFHRSDRPYVKNGKTFAQTIVRFSYWKPRLQAQRGKKIAREKKLPLQVRNDLTKRRYGLMRSAIDQLPARKDLFTYADANSNLVIRDGKNLHYYNSEDELNDIIRNI